MPTGPLRVLIVEDSDDDAELVARTFQDAGVAIRATRVDDAATLKRIVAAEAWDVVLSDHALAGLDSFHVIEVVKQSGCRAPILLVSGRIGEENAVKAVRLGASDYVPKDQLSILPSRVTAALARARVEAELDSARREAARHERLASMGVLVSGVAHEINNPLSFMRLAVELTRGAVATLNRDPPPDAAEARAAVERVAKANETLLRGIQRIARITEHLALFARSELAIRAPEDPATLAADAIAAERGRLPEGVVVETDYRARRRALAAEADIVPLLAHLIRNAAEALGEDGGGRITVRTLDVDDARVAIEVEDTGPGIPPAAEGLVFTPFFSTKASGTGLGLSLAHHVAKDHGGSLTHRPAPGRGTVFRLELPSAGA